MELGFLRKRRASTVVTKVKKTCQLFSYVIIMDFESTCWKDGKFRTQEIIEFPAVLLNTSSGEIESEFHYYVQPQENPILSDFCKELTGISQDQVEQGVSLSVCLKKFSSWLKRIGETHNCVYDHTTTDPSKKKCTFVTWSDWDLAVCLHYEAQRKQLRKPPELDSWIDLRATYRSFYDRKPKGLNGALQDLGIDFEGREHSGLHDSRNTARLAWRMMCDGCILKVTKSLTPVLSSSTCVEKFKFNPRKLKVNNPTASPKQYQVKERNSPCLGSIARKIQVNTDNCSSTENTLKKAFSVFSDKNKAAKTPDVSDVGPTSVRKEVFRDITNTSSSLSDRFKITNSMCKIPLVFSALSDSKSNTENIKKTYVFKTPVSVPGLTKPSNSDTKNVRNLTISGNKAQHLMYSNNPTTNRVTSTQKCSNSSISFSRRNSSGSHGSMGLNSSELPATTGLESSKVQGSTRLRSTSFQGSTGLQSSKLHGPSGQTLKRTPPMCECGRRTVRKCVQSPGPNMGRVFFCCPLGRSPGHKGFGKVKHGCGFFRWEVEASASPVGFNPKMDFPGVSSAGGSAKVCHNIERKVSLPQPNFGTPRVDTKIQSVLICSQKKTLGIKKSY